MAALLHMGRKDFQVKVRGHRVELAEIEMALLDLDDVKQAAVILRGDHAGDQHLVAYVVPAEEPAPAIPELRRALAARLPDYMLPSAFVMLQAMPLTPNGKLDRRALPAADPIGPLLACAFVAPRTPIEDALAGIWAEVLGVERVGVHDPFLELGGNSLLATQIASRVRDTFHVEVPLRTLLEATTVADMSVVIAQHLGGRVGQDELARLLAEVEGLSEREAP
jgi:surfactin family lipopeptide synthetase C